MDWQIYLASKTPQGGTGRMGNSLGGIVREGQWEVVGKQIQNLCCHKNLKSQQSQENLIILYSRVTITGNQSINLSIYRLIGSIGPYIHHIT